MKLTKLLQSGFSTFKAILLKESTPLAVTLRLTYRCNFKCPYCITGTLKEDEMSTEQVKQMIREFAEMGTQKITFTGGEAMVRDNIGELIDYAKEKGLITVLGSNGDLVPKFIDKLKNLDILNLSLDGKPDTHDMQRAKTSSYERVLEAIKLAQSRGIKVMTNTTLTNYNKSQIDHVLELSKKMDFKCMMQPMLDADYVKDQKTVDTMFLKRNEFREVVDDLIERKEKGENLVYSTETYKYFRDVNTGVRENDLKCLAGKLSCSVTPDGNVYPCSEYINKLESHNGTRIGFKNAFKKIPEVTCKTCEYTCYINNNLIFSFNIKTIKNTFKMLLAK